MLRCLIVDDEHLARERFISLLKKTDFEIQVVAEAKNGSEAIELIAAHSPDLIFLDIQMPGMSGFDVLDLLPKPLPMVIFVTAFDEFAIKAFEIHAIDYLTKPVRLERLIDSLNHVFEKIASKENPIQLEQLKKSRENSPLSRLSVSVGTKLKVIHLAEVIRIEAEDKLVYVYLKEGKFRTDFTLDELELRLQSSDFLRVHRSHIVQINSVSELIPWFNGNMMLKLSDGSQIPIARRRTAFVKSIFEGK
ncbi:MAG: response regulator [Chloroherpetonaceae bacterium]|nr:response regulator [Chloroherpetonaceae bacterium]